MIRWRIMNFVKGFFCFVTRWWCLRMMSSEGKYWLIFTTPTLVVIQVYIELGFVLLIFFIGQVLNGMCVTMWVLVILVNASRVTLVSLVGYSNPCLYLNESGRMLLWISLKAYQC